MTSAKRPSLLSSFLCRGSLIKRCAVPLCAFFTGDDAPAIFSNALARLKGFLVNSDEDASARYSICLDTAIAIIRDNRGASRANKTIIRSITGCMPLLFEPRLVLMPPYLHTRRD